MGVTAGWENFFVATAGASAALAGLLFVAISVNIQRILSIQHMPGRAGQTLMYLLATLLASLLGLVPGQTRLWLGSELLVVGGLFWLFAMRVHLRSVPLMPPVRRWRWLHFTVAQLATIPYVVTALSLLWGRGGGLYWVVPATLFSMAAAMMNGWVLLVEILR